MSTATDKHVYFFGAGHTDGGANLRDLLGGKGANVAEMSNLGVPVPPGFTITTEVCTHFMNNDGAYPESLRSEVRDNIKRLEEAIGAQFGSVDNPLLVSVRSGARVSMPGMMDTVLNLGLNDETVAGLAKRSNNPRFAYDSYRRFIQMYSDVVIGVHVDHFEDLLTAKRDHAGVTADYELSAEHLQELIKEYQEVVVEHTGDPFPQDTDEQLWGAIAAVFRSWNSDRAITYRGMNGYADNWGTAVNVQAMVFGNMGDDSATGVAFTRDPSTGERVFFGEYLINAQGEDVVAGIRTPLPINGTDNSLEKQMPSLYRELEDIYHKLEAHYRDMQDIEFTIQSGKLWLLQTRTGKRTGRAAVRIAVEMMEEKLIDKQTAVTRVDPDQLEQLLHPTIDNSADFEAFAKGLPASPGAASGRIAFTVERALAFAEDGERVILVRTETSPEDIEGMKVANAILTSRGGMTSHAAVVARGMGKCCVVGCQEMSVNYTAGHFDVDGKSYNEGDWITLDGTTGRVFAGEVPTVDPELDDNFSTFMSWVDEFRTMRVRANADTPEDAENARGFGAQGIGLARTEHMFFGEDRIDVVRRMILASDKSERVAALTEILPMQREDFEGLFRAMDGYPVNIRLLDPPLHEFLPGEDDEISALAGRLSISEDILRGKVQSLHEFNPMLGHRGCRLGITFPEIYEAQVRALVEAACNVARDGVTVHPEIMIPLIGTRAELATLREMAVRVADEVLAEKKIKVPYMVGTMIEVPRAALTADEVAEVAEFFSFGTNDLTQMAFGYSRDDASKFIPVYIDEGILPADPFERLDVTGVGQLVEIACQKGRETRPDIKLGICGEHGGDPQSIWFFQRVGLEYVSCSPFRVPVARLAAAQAAIASN